MTRFQDNEQGSVLPLFALSIGTIGILVSVVLSFGTQFLEDRRMQALADLIALIAVRDQNYSSDYALEIIADQGLDAQMYAPVLTPGHYVPDPARAPEDRFTPDRLPYNAVRVDLHARRTGEDGRRYISNRLAEAAAARRDAASFSVGSRLVRLEDGMSGALLASLLGYDGRITTLDYEALAELQIDSLDLLDAIAGEARIRAVTYDEILRTQIPPRSVLRAINLVAGQDAPGVLDRIADQSLRRADHIRVGDILEADAIVGTPVLDRTAGARVSALALIEATTLVAQGDNQVGVSLDATLAELQLAVGERPQSPPINAFSLPGSQVETQQLGVLTQLRLGLANLDIRVEAAQAEAELIRITCRNGGRVDADFAIETRPARLVIAGARTGLALLDLDLGSGEVSRVRMDEDDIESQSPQTLRSGIGADLSIANYSVLPEDLSSTLIDRVDSLLSRLGAHVGEADLVLHDARCGHAFLIE
jgi:uncharacterized membrane protein